MGVLSRGGGVGGVLLCAGESRQVNANGTKVLTMRPAHRECALLLAVAAVFCSSCANREPSREVADLTAMAATAESPESVSVRIGVRRSGRGQEERPTDRLRGYSFFKGTLAIDAETGAKLSQWFRAPESFRDWSGEKKCGGFHPDYAIEWKADGKSLIVLICFTCEEIEASFGRRVVRLDMTRKGMDDVRKLLVAARKNQSEKDEPTK